MEEDGVEGVGEFVEVGGEGEGVEGGSILVVCGILVICIIFV